MKGTSEAIRIYETILSIPGMQDEVKFQCRLPRKQILLLYQVVGRGLDPQGPGTLYNLLDTLPREALQDLQTTAQDWLKQAGLAELQEKLQALG